MCDGKGAAWTAAEKLAARERIGIGGDIEVNTLTLEEPASYIKFRFPMPKLYSTVIVQHTIPTTSGDTSSRFCPMYAIICKQDGSDEHFMYAWYSMIPVADRPSNGICLLSNMNGVWVWQVKNGSESNYFSDKPWTIAIPSYKSPAEEVVKKRPYVKGFEIGGVGKAFPAGTSVTVYGVL